MGGCDPNPECHFYPECYEDNHHLYWPRNDYTSLIERQFRALPENMTLICREEHEAIHANFAPPEKPSEHFMALAVIDATLEGTMYAAVRKRKAANLLLRQLGVDYD